MLVAVLKINVVWDSPTSVADSNVNFMDVVKGQAGGLALDGFLKGGDLTSIPHKSHSVLAINSNACNIQLQTWKSLKKGLYFTCTVVSTVLEPFQAVDQQVDDLLPCLGGQVVEVSENTTHLDKSLDWASKK